MRTSSETHSPESRIRALDALREAALAHDLVLVRVERRPDLLVGGSERVARFDRVLAAVGAASRILSEREGGIADWCGVMSTQPWGGPFCAAVLPRRVAGGIVDALADDPHARGLLSVEELAEDDVCTEAALVITSAACGLGRDVPWLAARVN